MYFYQVTVQREEETSSGRLKKVKDNYIVHAVSVTDAEVKATEHCTGHMYDFEVIAVKQTNIVDIIQ